MLARPLPGRIRGTTGPAVALDSGTTDAPAARLAAVPAGVARLPPVLTAWALVTLLIATAAPALPGRPLAGTLALVAGTWLLAVAATVQLARSGVPSWLPALASVGLAGMLRYDPGTEPRTALMALAALGPPLLIAIAAWGSRPAVGIALVSAALGLGRLLWYDPFFDARCTVGCRPLAPLLGSDPTLAEGLAVAGTTASLVAAAAAVIAVRRSVYQRILLALAVGATAIRVAHSPALGAEQASGAGQVALGVAGAVIGGALIVEALMALRERSRVRELVDSIEGAEESDDFERRLRQLVGDESLRLALPTMGGYVLLDGHQAPASLKVLSHLTVDDEPVAVLLGDSLEHGAPRLPARARLGVLTRVLERRLALDVEALAAGRTAMVVTAARTRRTLERDLHDGAQQEVLFAVSTLRAAERRGERLKQVDVAATAAAARERLEAALLDVRRVANSVHPHALTASGLESALDSLTDATQDPMRLRVRLLQPLSPEVELCLYTTIADVVARSAGIVHDVEVASAGATVRAVITGQGLACEGHTADRIGALRGTLTTQPTRIEIVLPCGR